MSDILQKDSPQLRQIAQPIKLTEINTEKISSAIKKMSQALIKEEDGVALAAPQIGLTWRIFIISHKIFINTENPTQKDLVFINPILTKLSRKKVILDEGCLSVRPLYGKVKRADKATVEALDETGKKFSWSATGLIAQIFQHEIDHLDGILFIDKASHIREVDLSEQARLN